MRHQPATASDDRRPAFEPLPQDACLRIGPASSGIRDDRAALANLFDGERTAVRRRTTQWALLESADALRTLAYEVTAAEARERERIARGLHDDIGQALELAVLKVHALRQAPDDAPFAALLDELHALLLEASRSTRSATFELCCPVLQQLGLKPALESLGQRMERLHGVRVHVQGELPASTPQAAGAVVFRVVRELLFNVQKHARAGNAWVTLRHFDGCMTVGVRDDGIGFDAVSRPARPLGPEGGFGLRSADAQMRAIGGRLELTSAASEGTHAVVTLPIRSA